MRAQATVSGGYCTALGFNVVYTSAVTLVRVGKHHGIEIDTVKTDFLNG
jgi:hypothetical protein